MANQINTTNPSRFHNLSDQALADAIGAADAVLKAAEAECKALKDEFKARGLEEVSGDKFTVTAKTRLRAGSIPQPSRSSWGTVTSALSGR